MGPVPGALDRPHSGCQHPAAHRHEDLPPLQTPDPGGAACPTGSGPGRAAHPVVPADLPVFASFFRACF